MKDVNKAVKIAAPAFFAVAVALLLGIFVYHAFFQGPAEGNAAVNQPATETSTGQTAQTAPVGNEVPVVSTIFGIESSPAGLPTANGVSVIEITSRLFLAVILASLLAFRPRRNFPYINRNLSVAQTQILLAVVAGALMMIVGDNVARAFAIFAAATLVRFRTNIRDPKEITILLISLALGMAAGVGRWELGAILCLFTLVLLWFLEQQEAEQVFRPMELSVKSRDTDKTQKVLKKIFKRYTLIAEVRELDPPDEDDPIGSITYYLDLPLNISTDNMSDRIFAFDSQNIEGVTWKHKKKAKFIG